MGFAHSKCDINAKTSDGYTPLLLAARNGNEGEVRLLIESGADVNCTDNDNWNILHYASSENWPDIVMIVAGRKDFDINARTSSGKTALLIAAEKGHAHVTKLLLKFRADVTCCDENQWNALHFASFSGMINEVDYILLNKLCDLNVRTSSGDSPVLLAASNYCQSVVLLFLRDTDADLNCRNNNNYNLLHYAAQHRWTNIIQCMNTGDVNFDSNIQTFDGWTALHLACNSANFDEFSMEVIDRLLDVGVDCNLKNENNETAFNLLRKYKCVFGIMKVLIEHGAYVTLSDYEEIYRDPELRETVLKDKELCTRIVINSFNHVHLPALYQIPGIVEHLPSIQSFQISFKQALARDIEKCVESEIETKQFCNVMEVQPVVLQMLCVRSFLRNPEFPQVL